MSEWLAAFAPVFAPAFTLWGANTSWLELVAVVLALAMVACNIRQIHWGWPLAALSSLLYVALFWRSKLYGDAALQVFFAVVALWGWRQWLQGRPGVADHATQAVQVALRPHRLSPRGTIIMIASCAALWPTTGLFLIKFTDTDVPWWDAFPTALSVVGQILLGRKFIENWLVWIVVNGVGVGLFAYKGLWLTTLLYLVFIALSVLGWRAWLRQLPTAGMPRSGDFG